MGEKKVSEINESEKGFLEASVPVFQQLAKVTTNSNFQPIVFQMKRLKQFLDLGDKSTRFK